MVKPKLIAAQKTAEGADNTDTELVELHLPDETATLQKILTETQQPPQDNGAVGVAPGTIQYSDQSRTTEEIVRDILGTVGNGVVHVGRIGYKVKEDYPQYPQKVLRWSADHPYQTAHLVGTAVLMVAPGFLAAPALSAVGFGKTIAGGSAATVWHAALGTVASPSTFATLQSAGAGGYGVPVIHGMVRAGAVAASSLGAITSTLKEYGKGDSSASESTLSAGSSDAEEHGDSKQGPKGESPSDGANPADEAKEKDFMLKFPYGKQKL
ncbi:MAG: hypothetical protein Q9221_006501 [Calogaya cf. arnoldii]